MAAGFRLDFMMIIILITTINRFLVATISNKTYIYKCMKVHEFLYQKDLTVKFIYLH